MPAELSAPMTSTQRCGLLRKRRAADGLSEVRGIWAPAAHHADIKAEAAKLIARRQRREKRGAG